MEPNDQNPGTRRFLGPIITTFVAASLIGVAVWTLKKPEVGVPPPSPAPAAQEQASLPSQNTDDVTQASPLEKEFTAPAVTSVQNEPAPKKWTDAEKKSALKSAGAMEGASLMEKGSASTNEWRGDHSGIRDEATVVVNSVEGWSALEKKHLGSSAMAAFGTGAWPNNPDFAKIMLIAIFDGDKPTAGYTLRLYDIRERKDGIHVYYGITETPPDEMAGQLLTQPYLLRKIPRSDLPVLFHKLPF